MHSALLGIPDESTLSWIQSELDKVFLEACELIKNMTLEKRFKDVIYETLNQEDFLDSVKQAFPNIDWDKTYEEFRAAGEERTGK